MAKANPANLLALAQKDAEKQIADIQAAKADAEKQIEEILAALYSEIKQQLATELETVLNTFKTIPLDTRKDVLSEPPFDLLLASLGLTIKTETKRKTKGARVERAPLSETEVYSFIGGGKKTKSELTAHFAGGSKKVSAILDSMVKSKALETFEKKGKGKAATAYKVK
jgi:hypothetical protein